MRWQHAAGAEIEHCHGKTVADDGREGCRISIDDGPRRECVDVLCVEVEEPVRVIGQER